MPRSTATGATKRKQNDLGDRKIGGKTLTIVKQELQVLFRQLNRKHFDGVLPEPHIFADRKLEVDGKVEWYLWKNEKETDEEAAKRGRPTIRVSYEYLMTEGIDDKVRNETLREYVHHWQYFTGRVVRKDDEFWAKAAEVGAIIDG